MAGSQTFYIVHKNGHEVTRQRIMEFLDWMQSWGHTYTRIWSGWFYLKNEQGAQNPWPCERTGPGLANDGLPKFDLSRPNKDYFKILRFFLENIERRSMFCSVMLFGSFNEWREKSGFKENSAWHQDNNVNAETNNLQIGTDFFSMESRLLKLQEAYLRYMVDELNEYDNFIWEIMNEAKFPESRDWQFHMINYLRGYEKAKKKQHLILMSGGWGEAGGMLEKSPADIISPDSSYREYFGGGPPENPGKIVISDTDHLWGFPKTQDVDVYRKWIWRTFTRGNHTVFLDYYDSYVEDNNGKINPVFDPVRRNLGFAASYSKKFRNLASMIPNPVHCSTGYCLDNNRDEMLVYFPGKKSVQAREKMILDKLKRILNFDSNDLEVKLEAGTYEVEWFDPIDESISSDKIFLNHSTNYRIDVPSHLVDDGVLFLKKIVDVSN
jgi:hypothetical protein